VEGESHKECTVHSPGEAVGTIATAAKTEVVYLGKEEEAKKEEGKLGDLFTPVSGETFVEIDIGGSGCPIFSKGEQEVKGSVIGEITPVATMAKIGTEIFPSKAIKKAYKWESAGTVKEVKAELDVFGVIEAVQIGEAEVELESGEEWGVLEK
jgi:hypothetical protein